MREFLGRLGAWFFARGDARTAAAVRIAFCAVYLAMLWDIYPLLHLLLGHGGVFGTLEPFPYDLAGPQYFLFRHDTPLELELFFWTSTAVTLAALVGFGTRVSVALAYASMFLLQERGPFIVFGADLVMRCVGLWLIFLSCGRVWSVDAWLRRRRGRAKVAEIELWPLRAIQLQVALVYLVTGLLKLRAPPWQDGSAVYYALQVGDVGVDPVIPWIFEQRALMAALDYGTLAIELAIPFMFLYRPLLPWAVFFGAAMHAGIALLMSIRFFGAAMFTGYLAFAEATDWDRARAWLRRIRRRAS